MYGDLNTGNLHPQAGIDTMHANSALGQRRKCAEDARRLFQGWARQRHGADSTLPGARGRRPHDGQPDACGPLLETQYQQYTDNTEENAAQRPANHRSLVAVPPLGRSGSRDNAAPTCSMGSRSR
jgi:hypothetical protein